SRVGADEVIKIFLHQHSKLEQDTRAFNRRRFHPAGKCSRSRFHGGIHFSSGASRAFRNHIAGGRIMDGCTGEFRLDPFATDEKRTGFELLRHIELITMITNFPQWFPDDKEFSNRRPRVSKWLRDASHARPERACKSA